MSDIQVNSTSLSSINNLNLNNPNLVLAQLQQEIAANNKDLAMEGINAIRQQQETSAAMTDALTSLRSLQSSWDFEKFGPMPSKAEIESELPKLQGALEEFKTLQSQTKESNVVVYTSESTTQYIHELYDSSQKNEVDGYNQVTCGNDNKHVKAELDNAVDVLGQRLESLTALLEVYNKCDSNGLNILNMCNVDMADKSVLSSSDFDTAIKNIESQQEQMNSGVQQQMVLIQDYMGQYNANTQGASSSVSKGNETNTAVNTGR